MTRQENQTSSVELAFRRFAGQIIAGLARDFGLGRLDLIEDSVQDAMIQALRLWPARGIPENPRAWLARVARNRLIDRLRAAVKTDSVEIPDEIASASSPVADTVFAGEFAEDELNMLFACCHPLLTAQSQIAVMLKAVGGFSVGEIADAFLAKTDAVAKLLTRARQRLQNGDVPLSMPEPAELPARLGRVLKALYLIFNEGYQSAGAGTVIRRDLCEVALRFARLLASNERTAEPRVHALIALFCFQSARFDARLDENGDLIPLDKQDRSRWNRSLILNGIKHFRLSAAGREMTDYHLEAEIASCHALAKDFATTDWTRILKCYDQLAERTDSPVVELNRAIAHAMVAGPVAGLESLRVLAADSTLSRYPLIFMAIGHFESEIGETKNALESYQRAAGMIRNERSQTFLAGKVAVLTQL